MLNSVVVSGPPAIGKTTIAKGIASEFNLTHLSGGDILKELASEQGFSTDERWAREELTNLPEYLQSLPKTKYERKALVEGRQPRELFFRKTSR